MNTALEMARQFSLGQEPETAEPYGCGHINETYRVTDATGKRWILQKINPHVFPDIPALMDNISHVTAYLREQIQEEGGDPERECLRLIPHARAIPLSGWKTAIAGGCTPLWKTRSPCK